jgi:VWFA-related protein
MSHPFLLPGLRRFGFVTLFSCLSLCGGRLHAQSPPPPPPAQDGSTTTNPTAQPAAPASADNQEVSSHDTPTTFKVRVNLVLVRVLVRDSHGQIVTNLKKEDFQLLDNGKVQTISSFSAETPEEHAASVAASTAGAGSSSEVDATKGKAAFLPQRFVSMMFDDVHMSMEDAVFVRDSARRFFESLVPSDRVAISTTSGQVSRDFTADRDALQQSLLGIVSRPLTAHSPTECPDISYYQGDLITNKSDQQALDVATQDTLECAFNNDPRMWAAAQTLARNSAFHVVNQGDSDTYYAYGHLGDLVRRLSSMPGQRVLVLVSPGFLSTTLQSEASYLVDRATRSNIVINTIDARGLYTPDMGDVASAAHISTSAAVMGSKASYRIAAQSAQEEVLAQLADGTGGKFYHNRNDVDEAMRQAGAAPSMTYLLGFSPQNMKIDGRYHTLKVKLTNKQPFEIQARRGYYAPKSITDPAEATKADIQEALFSQEEISDLPVDLQTQFFKKDNAEARLAVLAHFDVKAIHFRKALGRNNDKLTIVVGLFDENGNFVTGGQKVVEMKLLDATYNRMSHGGFTVKSNLDVKPGSYLVRLVVRDDEGAQMAARNGAVVIPY